MNWSGKSEKINFDRFASLLGSLDYGRQGLFNWILVGLEAAQLLNQQNKGYIFLNYKYSIIIDFYIDI